MGGEDFAYMLQARPGAYIFLGNGSTSQLHTDTYDFSDEAIPVGVSYWSRLVKWRCRSQARDSTLIFLTSNSSRWTEFKATRRGVLGFIGRKQQRSFP